MTEKLLSGRHINRGNSTLIVVFPGILTGLNKNTSLENMKNQAYVRQAHKQYHFLAYALETKQADFFFVEDFYNEYYGWFAIHDEKMIQKKISEELQDMIEQFKYTQCFTLGSSKGGFGALLYGMQLPEITKVFSIVPDILGSTELLGEYGQNIIFKNNNELKQAFDRLLFKQLEETTIVTSKKVFIYTGVTERQFQQQADYLKKLKEGSIEAIFTINPRYLNHTELFQQHQNFLKKCMNDFFGFETSGFITENHRLVFDDIYIMPHSAKDYG